MKNIVINLKQENIQKLKDNNLCLNCIYLLLKMLDKKEIIKIIENDNEYIEYKKQNKKNFKKNEYILITKTIKVDNNTYNKMNEIKEYLDISKNFIINKLIEKVI